MADKAAPSATALIIGTAILSLITGYFLGLGSAIGILPSPFSNSDSSNPKDRSFSGGIISGRVRSDLDEEESSSSEIDDDIVLDNAPNWSNGIEADRRQGLRVVDGKPIKQSKDKKPANERPVAQDVDEEDMKMGWEDGSEECKLVLVVRTDLGMTKGTTNILIYLIQHN